MARKRAPQGFGAPSAAGALIDVSRATNEVMVPYDAGSDFTVPNDPTLDSLVFSVQSGTLQTGLALDPDLGVISGTPTESAARALTIRGTNKWGTADTNSFTITTSGATLPLFSDAEVSANASTEGSERDLSAWASSGTPTLTAQSVLEGNTPQLIESDQTFERVEQNGHNITSGDTHRVSVVFEEPGSDNAAQFRVTFKDDDNGGAEDYFDVAWTPGNPPGATFTAVSQGYTTGPSNTSITTLSSDRYRAEFETTINATSTDIRFGIGPKVSDDTGIIIHSAALSESLSGGGGGGATPTSWVAIADAAGTDPYGNTFGTPSNANGIESSFAAAIADPVASIARLETVLANNGPGTVVVFKGNTEGSPVQYQGRFRINSPLSGSASSPIRIISSTDRGAQILGSTSGNFASPLLLTNTSHVRAYNLQLKNTHDGSDNAAIKIESSFTQQGGDLPTADLEVYGCICEGDVRNMIKATTVRTVKLVGNIFRAGSGGNIRGDYVAGFNTIIDLTIDSNDFINTNNGGGLGFKAWTNNVTCVNNYIETNSNDTDAVGIMVGQFGASRAGREFPFAGNDDDGWAECWDVTITNNHIKVNGDEEGIELRGGGNTVYNGAVIHGNFVEHSSAPWLRMTTADAALWRNQPSSAPAEQAAYVTFPSPNSNPIFDYRMESRGLDTSGGTSWVITGSNTALTEQNSATNSIGTTATAASAAAVLDGTIGSERHNRLTIYSQLGMPDGT